jgi:hypothetical protein
MPSITVRVRTGSKGTNGRVYAGVAGREFRLDKSFFNDFRPNREVTYSFGPGENVANDDLNDPNQPAINFSRVSQLPAYLRFEPNTNLDELSIDSARITVDPQSSSQSTIDFRGFFLNDAGAAVNELRLSMDTGLFCYLRRTAASPNSARITQVTARIRTREEGTNGFVYLGIAGREFCLNHTGNDFQGNSDTVFTLGTGSFLQKKELNDPNAPILRLDDLDTHPPYIRYEPRVASDKWRLDLVEVTVNPSANANAVRFRATLVDRDLTSGARRDLAINMGGDFGKMCYLRRV